MYIQKVIIKGFKTYRNETIIDDFSPHYNIIIGSNGSGKSNFFAAIRFVLSDDYSNLKREERQGLIHQGSGSVMSASVEIQFYDPGNSMILPSGVAVNPDSTVSIRRTVGLKKDDYQINDRNVTKSDIVRMMESTGFSMSNPYNIVPQGRIVALTNAKDKERLQILEDVVGAKSFEAKLTASLKKMEETEKKRMQIAKEMKELTKKLDEMEEERKELEKYNDLEGDRKVFQFTLYDRELNDIINQIEKLESEYTNILYTSEQYLQELDKREGIVVDITKTLQNTEASLKLKGTTELQQAKFHFTDLQNKVANYDVTINDIQSQINSQEEQTKIDQNNLNILSDAIKEKRKLVAECLPKFEELTKQENELRSVLASLQERQKNLMIKKGKYAKFTTVEERNKWIDEEVANIKEEFTLLKTNKEQLTSEQEYNEQEVKKLDEDIEDLIDSTQGPVVLGELDEVKEKIAKVKTEYSQKFDARRELWREEQRLQTILENMSEGVKRSERILNETMHRSVANGIKNVKEIVDKLNLPDDAVLGTLGELIKVSEKYKRCAEVIGGNSLFNIVVDTDETASLIMDELYRMKGGRVTFMPLNRIRMDSNFTYPPNDQASCTPLIKKIKFDVRYEKAVMHVFGKTIVVKDLGEGSKLAKRFKMNAITLDGDRADKRGELTGGYYDQHQKMKLDALKDLKNANAQFKQITLELDTIHQKLNEMDSSIDQQNSLIKAETNKQETMLTNIDNLNLKLNNKRGEKAIAEESIRKLKDKINNIEKHLDSSGKNLETFLKDREQPFDSELSEVEKVDLENITISISERSEKLNEITEELDDVSGSLDKLRAQLDAKLIPQYNNLKAKISTSNDSYVIGLKNELKSATSERDLLLEAYSRAKLEFTKLQNELEQLKSEKMNNQKILDKANSQQKLLLKKLDNFQKDTEKIMIKKYTLASRRDEIQQKIRELGLLPEESLSKYQESSSDELLNELNNITKELSTLHNVNKRAFENFKKFSEKQNELVERAKELDDSKNSIQELITQLKEQKITAVDTTFKKVSENFTKVFEKLVPRGTANLIIHRRSDDSLASMDINTDSQNISELVYTGVSISVSFNSKRDEQLHVEQLSGGQKTVCAIAMILAIQMVDPAPFYLFDEIDAALDKQYRTAVADVIKSLSSNAQFICTTFRTDMLQVADKFFRVKYENKISTVVEINRDSAINFIRGSNKIANI
ncbi:hypothetical protein TPHA_0I01090 [Tetrapisispora phaffii CBS 4417]|uniref:Structural maintenance of chromosomes protein n=1 Tax=Tetrapisispora phaffii (strain ATCC 24235 / CBS 4417 / NBRC 1672 / NRRL Y-8282 / UCD 70-5) TaxID=1071381 RepID=G8BXI7_TETPH|nr:hypothetical protein TPHA_0I01090 [Tetrapisispora phaffii CBS 4417]CCE64615.1 hypothetical protein TPHA_0I01090 [Tetrapisispora phaffii CBS 4417]